MTNERLLRSVIREMVLNENSSTQITARKIIDNVNIALGGADLIAAGAAVTGVGAPEALVWLKISGVIGGVVNTISIAEALTQEPPDFKGAAIDLAECIISILTIRAAGKVAKGIMLGADVGQAVASIIEGSTGETLDPEQRSTVVAAVAKARTQKPRARIIDANKVISELIDPGSDPDAPPMRKDEFLDTISGDIPLSLVTAEGEEDLYQIYLQLLKDLQFPGYEPSRVSVKSRKPKVGVPARPRDSAPTAIKNSPLYSFMPDGRILYNGSQVVGNFTSMTKGSRIPDSGMTISKIEYNDSGSISKVILKTPDGKLVNVPKIQ